MRIQNIRTKQRGKPSGYSIDGTPFYSNEVKEFNMEVLGNTLYETEMDTEDKLLIEKLWVK